MIAFANGMKNESRLGHFIRKSCQFDAPVTDSSSYVILIGKSGKQIVSGSNKILLSYNPALAHVKGLIKFIL